MCRIWTGADVGWLSVRAPEPTRCLHKVYAKPTPVPGVSWQESGETFLLSKSIKQRTSRRFKLLRCLCIAALPTLMAFNRMPCAKASFLMAVVRGAQWHAQPTPKMCGHRQTWPRTHLMFWHHSVTKPAWNMQPAWVTWGILAKVIDPEKTNCPKHHLRMRKVCGPDDRMKLRAGWLGRDIATKSKFRAWLPSWQNRKTAPNLGRQK